MKKMRREKEKMVVMSTERSRNGWMELEMDGFIDGCRFVGCGDPNIDVYECEHQYD